MAKIKNAERVNLTGKSVKELAHMPASEIKKYDRNNLARIVTKLNSAANKRLKRLKEAGYNTPAMRAAKVDKGAKLSVAGKNLKQLRAEYIRVSLFLKSTTSTQKGYKKFLHYMKKSLADNGVEIQGGDIATQDFIDKETRIVDWLKERNPLVYEKDYRYEVITKINDYINQGNLSELAIKRRLNKWLKKTYEQQQRNRNIDTSNFFDITEDDE